MWQDKSTPRGNPRSATVN